MTLSRFEVFIESGAELEARHAYSWYAERNLSAAAGFAEEVEVAVARLQDEAHCFPEVEPGIRRYLLRRYPYAILYRIVGDQVDVAAMMHLHREPGNWSQGR